MGVITFDGRQSSAYGIVVEHFPDYAMPKPDYEIIHVPGKNGDIIIDKGSFQNIERKYEVALANDPLATGAKKFNELITRLGEWLYPTVGYSRLSDDYDSTHFYMASFQNGLSIKNIENYGARATVSFNCKPFRYLNIGTESTAYTSNRITITNNLTAFSSMPLFKLTIHGRSTATNFNVGAITITINTNSIMNKVWEDSRTSDCIIILDCELQECYCEKTTVDGIKIVNLNDCIQTPQGFPMFLANTNYMVTPEITEITLNNNYISKVEVTPRWFTI